MRVKGAPSKAVSIAELAGTGVMIIGKGRSGARDARRLPDSGWAGRLGHESFLEPQVMTHAVHVRVDRDTGVTRVLRVAAARPGPI